MAYDEFTAKLVAENASLKAEVDRLRAALERIDRMAVYDQDCRDVLWAKIGIMRDIARAAITAITPIIRAEALEEAAQVTEQPLEGVYRDVDVRGVYANAIRALINQP